MLYAEQIPQHLFSVVNGFLVGILVELQGDLRQGSKMAKSHDVYLPDIYSILEDNQAQIFKLLR